MTNIGGGLLNMQYLQKWFELPGISVTAPIRWEHPMGVY